MESSCQNGALRYPVIPDRTMGVVSRTVEAHLMQARTLLLREILEKTKGGVLKTVAVAVAAPEIVGTNFATGLNSSDTYSEL